MSPQDFKDRFQDETSPLNGRSPSSELSGSESRHTWANLDAIQQCKVPPSKTTSGWYSLLFGQLITLFSVSQSAASFTLEYGFGKIFPFFMLLGTYLILSLHLFISKPSSGEELMHKIPFTPIRLRAPWWYYLFFSIVDVSPNYFTLLALKHTSLTSTTLLGSLSVPSTMIFCHTFLRKQYRRIHFLGIALCVAGGCVTVWIDAMSPQVAQKSHPHSYYGDMLAVLAALLYGIADGVGEFWSKNVDRKEYLGMLGFFGSITSFIFVVCFERDAVLDLLNDKENFLPSLCMMFWFLVSLVAFYISASHFLVSSDATMLLLSLQTSNLWAILYSGLVFREVPPPLFYVAACMVISGVFIYELLGNRMQESPAMEDFKFEDDNPTSGQTLNSLFDPC